VCQEWEDKAIIDSSGKKVKWKQATLKTRKSIGGSAPGKRIGGGDSDGDDDFMPTKKAATAAKARSVHSLVLQSAIMTVPSSFFDVNVGSAKGINDPPKWISEAGTL